MSRELDRFIGSLDAGEDIPQNRTVVERKLPKSSTINSMATERMVAAGAGVFMLLLGFALPLLWIFSFILFGLAVAVKGGAKCPCCGFDVELKKKRGIVSCRECYASLRIEGNRLTFFER